MTLIELVDEYNKEYNEGHPKRLTFDGYVVLVNGVAFTTLQAQERILLDNDKVFILPLLDAG